MATTTYDEGFLSSLPVADRVRLRGHATLAEAGEMAEDAVEDYSGGLEEDLGEARSDAGAYRAVLAKADESLDFVLAIGGLPMEDEAREELEELRRLVRAALGR
jgi:hypothetical protein